VQILGENTKQVYAAIGDYIEKGWYQVSLAANSSHMNEIVNAINNSTVFNQIIQSNQIGINALKLVDSNEFVLSMVFNPASKEAIGLMKSILRKLQGMHYFYGQKVFWTHTGIDNLIDSSLQELIDSFWGKKDTKDRQEKEVKSEKSASENTHNRNWAGIITMSIVILIILSFVTYRIILNKPDVVAKFSNQTILKLFYNRTKNEDVKISAIENLQDQHFLAEIVMNNDKKRELKLKAIAGINDTNVLMEICRDYQGYNFLPDMMKIISQNVKSKNFFEEAAGETNNHWVRAAVLPYIEDQDILQLYVQKEYHQAVRNKAVELISTDSVLFDVVKNEEKKSIRVKAAQMIKTNDMLIELIEKIIEDGRAIEIDIAEALIENITDQDYLYNLALKKINPRIDRSWPSEAAVKNIQDPKMLFEIAVNANWYAVRTTAIRKIDDVSALIYIAKNEQNDIGANIAIDKLLADVNFSDEAVLTEIALKRDSAYSLSEVNSEKYLARIVYNGSNWHMVTYALGKIRSPELLREIIENKKQKSSRIAKEAQRQLDNMLSRSEG